MKSAFLSGFVLFAFLTSCSTTHIVKLSDKQELNNLNRLIEKEEITLQLKNKEKLKVQNVKIKPDTVFAFDLNLSEPASFKTEEIEKITYTDHTQGFIDGFLTGFYIGAVPGLVIGLTTDLFGGNVIAGILTGIAYGLGTGVAGGIIGAISGSKEIYIIEERK